MRKTIMFCITRSIIGGAQKVVYSLIKGCYKDYNVILVCAPGGELVGWTRGLSRNIRIYELPYFSRDISVFNDVKTLYRLTKIIKVEKVDVVHCHSSKAGVLGRLAAWICGVSVRIYTVHGWQITENHSFLKQFLYKNVERLMSLISTHIVCVSKSDYQKGLRWRIASKHKVTTVYNGIEPIKAKCIIKDMLGLSDTSVILGTIARLDIPKNPAFSIKLYSKILKENPNLFFVWIGDGSLLCESKELVCELGLEKQFIFMGNREDAAELLGDFDIFSLLSDWEGLPISIIEAMYCGLPIIATNVGGVGELVENRMNGILVSKNEIDKARNEINILLDSNIRKQYGEASRLMVNEKFVAAKMVEAYKKLYN